MTNKNLYGTGLHIFANPANNSIFDVNPIGKGLQISANPIVAIFDNFANNSNLI